MRNNGKHPGAPKEQSAIHGTPIFASGPGGGSVASNAITGASTTPIVLNNGSASSSIAALNYSKTTAAIPANYPSASNSSIQDNNSQRSAKSHNNSNMNNPVQQCDLAYQHIRSSIDQVLKADSASTVDMIRIMEASQRIHCQLIKFSSKLSPHVVSADGINSRIAEQQAKDSMKDKRFSRGYVINELKELKPAFSVNLHANFFKISNCDDMFSYDGPMRDFIDAIFAQRLIPQVMDVLDEANCIFYDGCLVVEVNDHRAPVRTSSAFANNTFVSPIETSSPSGSEPHFDVFKILLKPTAETLIADIDNIRTKNPYLSDDALLQLESEILMNSSDNLCLIPSVQVARAASITQYNNRKLNYVTRRLKRYRTMESLLSRKSPVGHKRIRKDDDSYYTFLQPKHRPQNSSKDFKTMSFVEDWRKLKKNEEMTVNPVSDKIKLQIPRDINSEFKHPIRIMKFVKSAKKNSDDGVYTTLNIYILSDGTFEALLRWGTQPNTAVNGRTLRFSLSNMENVEIYSRNFISIYSQCESHQLLTDSKLSPDQLSLLQQQIQLRRATVTARGSVASSAKHSALNLNMGIPAHVVAQQQHPPQSVAGTSAPSSAAQSPAISPSPSSINLSVSNTQQQPPQSSSSSATVRHVNVNPATLQQRMQSIETKVQRQQQQRQTSQSPVPPLDAAAGSATAVPSNPQVNATASVTPNIQTLASNPALLHKLLRLPFHQVPDEYKNLYLQLRQKLQTRHLMQQQQQQQQQQAQQQAQQQQVQQQQARANSLLVRQAAAQNQQAQNAVNQQRLQQLMHKQQLMQSFGNQATTAQQMAAAQAQLGVSPQMLQQQTHRIPAASTQQLNMAQLQRMASMNPVFMNSLQTNPSLTLQQMNLLIQQQQQQQLQQQQRQQPDGNNNNGANGNNMRNG